MTIDELEDTFMNGVADEVTGDVDAPGGHVYRVGQFVSYANDYWRVVRVCRATLVIEQTRGIVTKTRRVKIGSVKPV